jgi:hypothetical protein
MRTTLNNERPRYQPNRQCKFVNEIIVFLEHLYIEGQPGIGKTELIDYLTRGRKVWKAGEPSNFLFGTLQESTEIIWFEDYDPFKYTPHLQTILSLMDHKPVSVSQKGVDDKIITCNARFIFTSSYPIPPNQQMFNRRIKHIYIDHAMHTCLGCQPTYVPQRT